MCLKITTWLIILVLVALTAADTVEKDVNATKIIKESPLIFDTVLKNYPNPTIDDYYACVKRRDKCLGSCKFMDRNCQSKCPTCPVLYNHDILVQGINDTEYRPPVTDEVVNQTNIIRVVNEIRNMIDTKLGTITSNNQNLINVYQNKTSKVGGKFGLGYNEKGPCCHLIEPKRCKRSGKGFSCAPRHQRTCGSHCISRVMRAKRFVACNEMNPDDCTPIREYIPEHRRPGCRYISRYPFIDCGSLSHRKSRVISCDKCLAIPYKNVIRREVPTSCLRCYGHSRIDRRWQFHPSSYSYYQRPPYPYPMHPQVYGSYIPPPVYDYDFEDDYDTSSGEDDYSEHSMPELSKSPELSSKKCNSSDEDGCQDMKNNIVETELDSEASHDDEQVDENDDDAYEYDENDSN